MEFTKTDYLKFFPLIFSYVLSLISKDIETLVTSFIGLFACSIWFIQSMKKAKKVVEERKELKMLNEMKEVKDKCTKKH